MSVFEAGRRRRLAAVTVLILVAGLVLFVIVTAIPLLGWLISFIVILLGLGTLWIWGRTTLPRMLAGRAAAS